MNTSKLKDVPGYEGIYCVSYDGEVYQVIKNYIVNVMKDGTVSLRKNGENKSFKLDQLVYSLFIDSSYDGVRKINHVDGNKFNCSVVNLTTKSSIEDLPGEIWVQYFPKHEISNYGRVKYLCQDKLTKIQKSSDDSVPYVQINQKSYRLAELVADVFLERKPNQCVSYIDGDFNNVHLSNLSLDLIIPSEEGETWKPVKDFEDRYQISSFGRLYSVPRKERRNNEWVTVGGRFLNPAIDEDGYYKAVLVKDTVTTDVFVHRLVAINYIENADPEIFDCVNHIDGNKRNNHVENLEWCDNQQNVDHAMKTGLRDNVGSNSPRTYATIVVDTEGVRHKFYSIQQASYFMDVDPESLRLYLHGSRNLPKKSRGNYVVYKTTKDDNNYDILEPFVRYRSVKDKSTKKVKSSGKLKNRY